MALGLGMNVVATDKFVEQATIKIDFFNGQSIDISIKTQAIETVFAQSDFISLHVPAQNGYLIDDSEIALMKNNVGIINCSRGGIISEVALVKALDNGKILFAGLDVFDSEPTPAVQILMHPKISLTPHIGAATLEAQDRIGTELAAQIIAILKS